jgi:hypothetical protein
MTSSIVIYTSDRTVDGDPGTQLQYALRVNSQVLALAIAGTTNTADTYNTDAFSNDWAGVVGKRRYGTFVRRLHIQRRNVASGVTTLVNRIVPILKPALYISALSTSGPGISYEEHDDWYLVGARPELFRPTPSSLLAASS